MKKFNVTGTCYPTKHYMVNLDSRLQIIKNLIGEGNYFTINRARQYGKTTLLSRLRAELKEDYIVFFISLEGVDAETYHNATSFCGYFCGLLYDAVAYGETDGIPEEMIGELKERSEEDFGKQDFRILGNFISTLCKTVTKPMILMIDEVDQASGYEIFLKFLGMLRDKYLRREERPTFQSVILASVYDIKNLKRKLRPDEDHKHNSLWNIAADFNVDMSFCVEDISGMLLEYEKEHRTGMDVMEISQMIYDYTSGYPYLVSRLCQLLDKRNKRNPVSGVCRLSDVELDGRSKPDRTGTSDKNIWWTREGMLEVVKDLLRESNTLFDDMIKKLSDTKELKQILYKMLFEGNIFAYNPDNAVIDIGRVFGFIKDNQGTLAVSNRIFETRLYNLFLSEEMIRDMNYKAASSQKNQFIANGQLNMELVLQKFMEHFTEIYGSSSDTFLEENGRRFFLLYLKPIINGVGNYYIESRTRNMGRTDVIVDYLGQQYVIEMKIWRGNEYHERGEEQLLEYLEAYHLNKGYMISFNFNQKKQVGMQEIHLKDKILVEAVV